MRAKETSLKAIFSSGESLPLLPELPVRHGDQVTVGLRPEHIKIAADGEISAEVEVVEPLGLSTQFYVQVAGQQLCVFAMGRSALAPGDRIKLSTAAQDLHVFNSETGHRIG